ncbi:MAG TPA: ShlB/FhaC/HecB family hemolysin secretion/activation protein [Caulobacteraceae bacterium]|nr:ShlB/FhaC/HecB family hemolysin secretion/activation protein [Caulobacteraceae bacterium]
MLARVKGLAGPVLFCQICFAAGAHAQDYAHVAPKQPEPTPAPTVTAPPSPLPQAQPQGDQVLVAQVKGLVFVNGVGALAPNGRTLADAGASKVSVRGVPGLEASAFAGRIAHFIGKPLTKAGLQKLRDETRTYLARHGHPYVAVTVPPQNVTSGVIQVVVTPYRLGNVTVTGGRYFNKRVIEEPNSLQPGQILTLQDVQTDVSRLNENPFLNVDTVFRPGETPGTTDIELAAKDRLPIRIYAGYDNQGYPLLGLQEFSAGINWGNAFGDGQILSYQFTRSFNGRFVSHSGSDVIPIESGDKILIFGSYETMQPNLGIFFNEVGHAGQISIRFVHDIRVTNWLTGDFEIGYDYKVTNNNLQFFGFTIIKGDLQVDQFPITVDLTETDRQGQTTLENDLVLSPGDITANNTDVAAQSLVAGGTVRYVYDRLSVTRTTRLPDNFSWVSRVAAQVSTGILPDSEQLGGGGVGSVRGYYTDTALGSVGVLTNQEIRLPAFSPTALVFHHPKMDDLAQVGAFFDVGEFRQPQAIVGGAPTADLMSTGVLAHYAIGRRFDVDFDMGWQLRTAPNQPTRGYYGAVALTASY